MRSEKEVKRLLRWLEEKYNDWLYSNNIIMSIVVDGYILYNEAYRCNEIKAFIKALKWVLEEVDENG